MLHVGEASDAAMGESSGQRPSREFEVGGEPSASGFAESEGQRPSREFEGGDESSSRVSPAGSPEGGGWSVPKSRALPTPRGGAVGSPPPPPQVLTSGSRFAPLAEGFGSPTEARAEAVAEGTGVRVRESGVKSYRRNRRWKPMGDVAAHARYLQHVFRRTRAIRPGCWVKGGLRGLTWWRAPTVFACHNGLDLAPPNAFERQRRRAEGVLAWYSAYVVLHRRLHSSRTPTALVDFCGEGGVSEGVRRAGGAHHGVDVKEMGAFVRRYGPECFTQADGRSPTVLRALTRKLRPVVSLASPPCKSFSTGRMRGQPKEPPMIKETREALQEVGGLYAIENVTGAVGEMGGDLCLLRGAYFGEHVDRPRYFESNFSIHVDRCLKEGGDELRRGTCLGHRRRWRRLDPYGRPEMADCCEGNLWSVQGDKPLRCTPHECARAMGIDDDHMTYAGLSQAIPPAYSQLVFAQACMRDLEQEFGVVPILYDEFEAAPVESRRKLSHLLRGAGGEAPSQGVEFSRAPLSGAQRLGEAARTERVGAAGKPGPVPAPWAKPEYRPLVKDGAGDEWAEPDAFTVREAEIRELCYSWAGDFDNALVGRRDLASLAELGPIRDAKLMVHGRRVEPAGDPLGLRGRNSLICWGESLTLEAIGWASDRSPRLDNTRLTVEVRGAAVESAARAAGFKLVRRIARGQPAYSYGDQPARLTQQTSFWAWGIAPRRRGRAVDYAELEAAMDPADRTGAVEEPKTAKAARSYMPIPWEPRRWDIGLPRELNEMMAGEGVGVHVWEEPGFSEVPFYPFASPEGLMKSIVEADRAIITGAMEYVPADKLEEVRQVSTIHPWTIVDQGGGKWRLCHDYSVGTNRVVSTAPFALPSVWDVAGSVGPSTHFAKYDIRDGFWHCPIAANSRKRFVVRHPGTGRLMWATRLPFGYLDSPRLFCGLTEAIIARVREKLAGKGVKLFVFVDDCLVVGKDREATLLGMRALEEEFAARGVQWAPHKKRGPCKCIEFLGLMLANTTHWRGVTLSRKRLERMQSDISSWLGRRPDQGLLDADPKEVASLLGRLVFAAQVVPNGRTYMQGMLQSFKGMVVDWRRGTVSVEGASGQRFRLGDSFWRDLEWWDASLAEHAFTPFARPQRSGEMVLAGTDASGWGTGQVIWRDGGREEYHLRFTAAEKRRPINWRELLGIVRAAQHGGELLRGKRLLVESDNMAAVASASGFKSKAADMQELVRRLLRLSQKHGSEVKVTHTPGAKLDRPDQTSRGDAVEEPRVRLTREQFKRIEGRFGPFGSFIGSERGHAQCSNAPGQHMWAHPTYNTVGSALRRVAERFGVGDDFTRCVACLPDDGDAGWAPMLKHGVVVGRYAAGSPCLELNSFGHWVPTRARRPMRVVLFPRAAGSTPRRVAMTHRESLTPKLLAEGGGVLGSGYKMSADGRTVTLAPLPGSFVYSMPGTGEAFGTLHQVCEANEAELASNPDVLVAREVLRAASKAAKASAKGQAGLYACEVGRSDPRHRPDPSELWMVDHLITEAGGGRTFERFVFDAGRAHSEIEQLQKLYPRHETGGWQLSSPESWSSSPFSACIRRVCAPPYAARSNGGD